MPQVKRVKSIVQSLPWHSMAVSTGLRRKETRCTKQSTLLRGVGAGFVAAKKEASTHLPSQCDAGKRVYPRISLQNIKVISNPSPAFLRGSRGGF